DGVQGGIGRSALLDCGHIYVSHIDIFRTDCYAITDRRERIVRTPWVWGLHFAQARGHGSCMRGRTGSVTRGKPYRDLSLDAKAVQRQRERGGEPRKEKPWQCHLTKCQVWSGLTGISFPMSTPRSTCLPTGCTMPAPYSRASAPTGARSTSRASTPSGCD